MPKTFKARYLWHSKTNFWTKFNTQKGKRKKNNKLWQSQSKKLKGGSNWKLWLRCLWRRPRTGVVLWILNGMIRCSRVWVGRGKILIVWDHCFARSGHFWWSRWLRRRSENLRCNSLWSSHTIIWKWLFRRRKATRLWRIRRVWIKRAEGYLRKLISEDLDRFQVRNTYQMTGKIKRPKSQTSATLSKIPKFRSISPPNLTKLSPKQPTIF